MLDVVKTGLVPVHQSSGWWRAPCHCDRVQRHRGPCDHVNPSNRREHALNGVNPGERGPLVASVCLALTVVLVAVIELH